MHASALADGPAKVAMLEEAIALADSANDTETGYAARNQLMGTALQQGLGERIVVAFSWCLTQSDRDPQKFPEIDILWEYRWVMFAMPSFADVSKAQIDSMLGDMEARYRKAGSTLRGYYLLRQAVRWMMADAAETREAFRQFKAARRDWLSDDVVTERTFAIDHHIFLEEYSLAYGLLKPFLTGELRDKHFSATSLGDMLVPMVRLGHLEDAMNAHKRSYPNIADNPRYVDAVGDHMGFLALTDNLTRATRIYEKHLGTALSVNDRLKKFTFHLGAALTLMRLADRRETVRLKLPKAFDGYEPEGSYSVAALRDRSLSLLRDEARAFDARNGNDYYSRQVENLSGMEALVRPFPVPGAG